MKTSKEGIDFIKYHEGVRLVAYPDVATGGPPFTIGFGSTHGVHKGMTITLEEADAMLRRDLLAFEAAVSHAVTVPLTQHQFDALVSFTYNLGPANLHRSSMLVKLNAGDTQGAADAMLLWDMGAGHHIIGLRHRREEERKLFLMED